MDKKIDQKFERLLEEAIIESFEEEISQLQIKKYPLTKTFKKQMKNLFRPKNWQSILKKVAIFLLIFTGGFSLLIANNQTAQAAFQNFLAWATEYRDLVWYSDHLSIEISPKEEDHIRVDFKEAYIPEEYRVVEFNDYKVLKDAVLLDSHDNRITMTVVSTDAASSIGVDNEHTIYRVEELNNRTYLIGEGIDDFGNNIFIEYKGFNYHIKSLDITTEEMLEIMEKIFENMENSL
ncbi:MAG: DUF4367 domain-containing protein [Bacillota bacterium]|nr:DUF4367 domain-containing protein [Bacillota bacterium]